MKQDNCTLSNNKVNDRICPWCGEQVIDIYAKSSTDWYGDIEWAICDNCGEELIAQNRGDFEIAA